MVTNAEYKDRALESLKGNWDKAVIVTLIYAFIYGLVPSISPLFFVRADSYSSGLTLFQLVLWVLLQPLAWGFVVYFLYMARKEYVGIERMFDGFQAFKRITLTRLLVFIYTFLWSLLLVIPGIIKAYSYSMTDYILRDEPGMAYDAAITRSMEMMQGHKMDLFLLHLSFIGWFLLSCLTCGLGLILLTPYFYTAQAHFYEELKEEFGQGNVII